MRDYLKAFGQSPDFIIAKRGRAKSIQRTGDILHAKTLSGAFTEWNEVFAQLSLGRLEPSFGLE